MEPSATSLKEGAKVFMAQAKQAYAAKDYQKALECYSEAIKLTPDDHILYSNRSACYANLQQFNEALADAKKCTELRPDFPKGYERRGLAEFYLKQYDAAIASYTKGLELDPNNEQLKKWLAEAKKLNENLFGSHEEILEKLKGNMFTNEYLKDPGYQKEIAEIEENNQLIFNKIKQDYKMLRTFSVLTGIAIQELKESAANKSDYKEEVWKKIKVEEEREQRLLEEYKKKMEEEEKRKREETEMKKAKSGAEEQKAKGNEAYKAKNFAVALECYAKAIELNPKEPSYYTNKASAYLEMHNYEECLKACDEAIKVCTEASPKPFEKLAKAYARKGNCYMSMMKYTEAIQMYDLSLLEVKDKSVKDMKKKAEDLKKKKEEEEYIDPKKGEGK